MVVINTTDDLLRLLDENEQFRTAVRNKILTEELIKLPAEFKDFKKEFNEFKGEMTEFKTEMKEFKTETKDEFSRVNRRLDGIGSGVGDLKGHFAAQGARQDAEFIAAIMGLEWQSTLKRIDVLHIWQAAERNRLTDDISSQNRTSFLKPDIIIEATDKNGKCYVAVEISYTAGSNDTRRAIRNARYLTQFTGDPAYMAVAGVSRDSEIESVIIEENPQPFDFNRDPKVFWLQLDDIGSPE